MWTDTDLIKLARRAAEKLEGYSHSLQYVLEEMGEDGADDQMPFCRELDRLVFECQGCGYWHRQMYNATPGNSEWKCTECAKEEQGR